MPRQSLRAWVVVVLGVLAGVVMAAGGVQGETCDAGNVLIPVNVVTSRDVHSSTYAAAKLSDGDLTTRYSSPDPGDSATERWVMLDLGQSQQINHLDYHVFGSHSRINGMKVYVSNDSTVSSNPAVRGTECFEYDLQDNSLSGGLLPIPCNTMGRYVLLVRSQDLSFSMFEIQVFGCMTCDASSGEMTDASLVHWLRFENGGVLNYDSITGAALGTFTGTAGTGYGVSNAGEGYLSNALQFKQKQDSTLEASASDVFGSGTTDFSGKTFSIAFWYKFDSGTSDGTSYTHGVDGNNYPRLFRIASVRIVGNDNSGIAVQLGDSAVSTQYTVEATNIKTSQSQWHHVCVVFKYDTFTKMSVYSDGIIVNVLDAYDTSSYRSDTFFTETGADWLIFGNNRGYDKDADGWIDDLRIYNRALTPAEIWDLAQQGRSAGTMYGGYIGAGVEINVPAFPYLQSSTDEFIFVLEEDPYFKMVKASLSDSTTWSADAGNGKYTNNATIPDILTTAFVNAEWARGTSVPSDAYNVKNLNFVALAQHDATRGTSTPELLPCTCETGAPDLGHGTCGTCDASAGQMTDAGLVHWLRFENGGSLNYDSVTGAALGTFDSIPAMETSDLGHALRLDKNVFDIVPTGVDLSTSDFTIAFRTLLLDGFTSSGADNFYPRMFGMGGMFDMAGDTNGDGNLYVKFDDPSSSEKTIDPLCNPALCTMRSLHDYVPFAVTYSSVDDNFNIYAYGIPTTDTDITTSPKAIANVLKFGTGYLSSNKADMKLDDLRIYNRVLTPAEIAALAAQDGSAANPEIIPCEACPASGCPGDADASQDSTVCPGAAHTDLAGGLRVFYEYDAGVASVNLPPHTDDWADSTATANILSGYTLTIGGQDFTVQTSTCYDGATCVDGVQPGGIFATSVNFDDNNWKTGQYTSGAYTGSFTSPPSYTTGDEGDWLLVTFTSEYVIESIQFKALSGYLNNLPGNTSLLAWIDEAWHTILQTNGNTPQIQSGGADSVDSEIILATKTPTTKVLMIIHSLRGSGGRIILDKLYIKGYPATCSDTRIVCPDGSLAAVGSTSQADCGAADSGGSLVCPGAAHTDLAGGLRVFSEGDASSLVYLPSHSTVWDACADSSLTGCTHSQYTLTVSSCYPPSSGSDTCFDTNDPGALFGTQAASAFGIDQFSDTSPYAFSSTFQNPSTDYDSATYGTGEWFMVDFPTTEYGYIVSSIQITGNPATGYDSLMPGNFTVFARYRDKWHPILTKDGVLATEYPLTSDALSRESPVWNMDDVLPCDGILFVVHNLVGVSGANRRLVLKRAFIRGYEATCADSRIACPDGSLAAVGSTSQADCGGDSGVVCPAGQYLSGTTCADCDAHQTSLPGSTASTDCGCPPGSYLADPLDTSCTACTGDTYKSGIGDDSNLCLACPGNSTIDPDSLPAPTRTSAAECECAAGFYGVPGDVHEYRIVRTDGGAGPVVFDDLRFLDESGGAVQIYAKDPAVKEPGGSGAAPITATVAAVTAGAPAVGQATVDGETVYTFLSDETSAQTEYTLSFDENVEVDVVVVGGGGGGGKRHAGGGGGGTVIYHTGIQLSGTYHIEVGAGGQGVATGTRHPHVASSSGSSLSGQYSRFSKSSDSSHEYKAVGGGGGATSDQTAARNGGRGMTAQATISLSTDNVFNGNAVSVINSGADYDNSAFGLSSSDEGCFSNLGGIGIGSPGSYAGGGGGGAGGAGMSHDTGASNLGYGGNGLSIEITGSPVFYGGGGGGANYNGGSASVGVAQVFDPSKPTRLSRGGGGYGSDIGNAQDGLAGTGGGGGAQGNDGAYTSGSGGSGVVIVRVRAATPPPPAYITSLETLAATTTGVSGWTLVRYLMPSSTTWHPIDDNLAGTTTYGTAYDTTNNWSIEFGSVSEFLLATCDLSTRWMRVTKANLLAAGAGSTDLDVEATNSNASPQTLTVSKYFYSAATSAVSGEQAQPWACLSDVGVPATAECLYGEGSWTMSSHFTNTAFISTGNGLCVFVRPYITSLETLAATTTGVSGWTLVRYLPACAVDTVCIYSGNDDFAGTYILNEGTKLETEEWSTGFDAASVSEILLAKGTSAGFEKWVYASYSQIVPPSSSGWTTTTSVLQSDSSASATIIDYYHSISGRDSTPWIYPADPSTDGDMVFLENNGYKTDSSSTQEKTDSFDDGKWFYVLVR